MADIISLPTAFYGDIIGFDYKEPVNYETLNRPIIQLANNVQFVKNFLDALAARTANLESEVSGITVSSVNWSQIQGKPTTLEWYGITNVYSILQTNAYVSSALTAYYTKLEVDAKLSALVLGAPSSPVFRLVGNTTSVNSNLDLSPLTTSGFVRYIETSVPATVAVYYSTADRTADATRLDTTPNTAPSVRVLTQVKTQLGALRVSVGESYNGATIYLRISAICSVALGIEDAATSAALQAADLGPLQNRVNLLESRPNLTNVTNDAQVKRTELGVASGVATLDISGHIPSSQLPFAAIGQRFVVGSQAEMLALTAQIDDIAVRTDMSNNRFLLTGTPGTLTNWVNLDVASSSTGGVSSVQGYTGNVVLVPSDIGAASDSGLSNAVIRISSNESSITNLQNRANTDESSITALTTRVSTNESNLASNTTRLTTDEANITSVTNRVSTIEASPVLAGVYLTTQPANNTYVKGYAAITTSAFATGVYSYMLPTVDNSHVIGLTLYAAQASGQYVAAIFDSGNVRIAHSDPVNFTTGTNLDILFVTPVNLSSSNSYAIGFTNVSAGGRVSVGLGGQYFTNYTVNNYIKYSNSNDATVAPSYSAGSYNVPFDLIIAGTALKYKNVTGPLDPADLPAGTLRKIGGTTGQILAKNSNTDGDLTWIDTATGGSNGPSAVTTLPSLYAEYDFTSIRPTSDKSGNGRDLGILGTPTFDSTGVSLNGIDQAFKGDDTTLYGGWTFGLVCNLVSTQQNGNYVSVLASDGARILDFETFSHTGMLGISISGIADTPSTSPSILGIWQHLTFVGYGDFVYIYRSGEFLTKVTMAGFGLGATYLFSSDGIGSPAKGKVAYTYITDYSMSPNEINVRNNVLKAKYAPAGILIPGSKSTRVALFSDICTSPNGTVAPNWTITTGTPLYRAGALVSTTNTTLSRITLVTYTVPNDYTVQASMRKPANGNISPGITFRAVDADNLYLLQIPSSGTIDMFVCISGAYTNILSVPINTNYNVYDIRIILVGSLISVYLGNTLVGSVTDSTFTSGAVGLQLGEVRSFKILQSTI